MNLTRQQIANRQDAKTPRYKLLATETRNARREENAAPKARGGSAVFSVASWCRHLLGALASWRFKGMRQKAIPRETLAIVLIAALSVYALALLSPAIFNDADTYWHISAGQWMLAHRTVLDHDVFSRAFPGKPWTTGEWLSEVLMASAYGLAGWSGVAILTGLAMAAAVIPLGLYLGKKLDPVPCLVVLVLGIACVMPDYLARPHILALSCLTIWMIGLAEAASAQRRPAWWLLPVMTLWANLHGSFVFGLALLVPMALEAALGAGTGQDIVSQRLGHDILSQPVRGWALFAAAAVAATLINPHGIAGLTYPFDLLRVQSLSAVGEWQPLDLRQFNPVEVSALAAAFFFLWRGIRVPPIRLLILIVLFHQTLAHARYGLFLGIAAPILLADSLAETVSTGHHAVDRRAINTAAALAAAALVVFFGALRIAEPMQRSDGLASPVSAFRAVPASLANEPVFNDYTFGGYLIFHGVRPLVDSRADFYGDAYLADYAKVVGGDTSAVDRLFRKYHVAWTMLRPRDPLVTVLDRRPGWHRVFADRYAIIHVGPTVIAANMHRLSTHNPLGAHLPNQQPSSFDPPSLLRSFGGLLHSPAVASRGVGGQAQDEDKKREPHPEPVEG